MMLEESKGFNNEIFDVIDIFEKLTDKVKKNIVRINFMRKKKKLLPQDFCVKFILMIIPCL